jgi:4-aminobutyrate--pyruvate transaminase
MNERIFESVMAQSDKLGAFVHGYTYAGHPVAASVALETLKIYEEMDLIGHVKEVEPVFLREMGALVDHPMVGNFSGIGLIGGIEIVQDRATKRDWPAEANLTTRLDTHARANGLILRITGNRVAFSPPLIITAEEIRELARRLRRTLDATHAELRAL